MRGQKIRGKNEGKNTPLNYALKKAPITHIHTHT